MLVTRCKKKLKLKALVVAVACVIILYFGFLFVLAQIKEPSTDYEITNAHVYRDLARKLWPSNSGASILPQSLERALVNFLIPRAPGTFGHYKLRQIIKKDFTDMGWGVEEDSSAQATPVGSLTFSNVIATLDPRVKSKIVLACHYDSKRAPAGFIGAMDSAVPCAMMVSLAQTLTEILRSYKSNMTIQMIFLDGEEALVSWTDTDSLYGSRQLASKWFNIDPRKNVLANIVVFILLDLIGHSRTQFQRHFKESDAYYTQLMEIENQLKSRGLLTRGTDSPPLFQDARRPFNIPDDHIPFIKKGTNVMHLITYPYPVTWHTLGDNAESINKDLVRDLFRILAIFLVNITLGGSEINTSLQWMDAIFERML